MKTFAPPFALKINECLSEKSFHARPGELYVVKPLLPSTARIKIDTMRKRREKISRTKAKRAEKKVDVLKFTSYLLERD